MTDLHVPLADPFGRADWDSRLGNHPDAGVFHTAEWARVLQETYGYEPLYAPGARTDAALWPVMEVRSRLTGHRGVSLPFTDYCDPLLEPAQVEAHLERLCRTARQHRWRYLELRPGQMDLAGRPVYRKYLRHSLELGPDAQALFDRLRPSVRRNIRKARRLGIRVERSVQPGAVREYYRLHCLIRKHHGLPPQPFRFFERIGEHLLRPENGLVLLARHDQTCIAGAVFLRFRDRAFYKFGACDRRYQQWRPNDLLFWEAIEWLGQNGHSRLCLGRTEPENTGLRRFKMGWGAREFPLYYYRYHVGKDAFVAGGEAGVPGYPGFRHLPVGLLKLMGACAYRHMG
ncbi:MAG: GNAT family N-acetyltransferase [Sedimentisphaerales bacterium]|nr:GNAT family N-acetyltransferase [Sedimentisphaerales bacterium]